MKKIWSTILIFLPLSFLIGQSNSEYQGNWTKYETKKFEISFPETWELDTSGMLGTSFFLFSTLESNTDDFRENINLIIQDLNGLNIDIEKFTDLSIGQIEQFVQDAFFLQSEDFTKDDTKYHRLEYTGQQGKLNLHFIQHYTIVNGEAYILTLTLKNPKSDSFYRLGSYILNSLKLK